MNREQARQAGTASRQAGTNTEPRSEEGKIRRQNEKENKAEPKNAKYR